MNQTSVATKSGVLALLRDIECMPEHPCDDARNAAALTIAKHKAGEICAIIKRAEKALATLVDRDLRFFENRVCGGLLTKNDIEEARAVLAELRGA